MPAATHEKQVRRFGGRKWRKLREGKPTSAKKSPSAAEKESEGHLGSRLSKEENANHSRSSKTKSSGDLGRGRLQPKKCRSGGANEVNFSEFWILEEKKVPSIASVNLEDLVYGAAANTSRK